MPKKIAIEGGLTNVKKYLRSQGYDVETVENVADADKFDAIIVTGLNNNFLGIGDAATKSPVIDASGLTPEEIHENLKRTIG
jgi:hypothetical protein